MIVWFPPDRPDDVVIALFAGDKATWATCYTTVSAPELTRRSRATSWQPKEKDMAEKITFVGSEAAEAKIARLRARPGTASRGGQIRAQMEVAHRAHADSLAATGRQPT